MHSALLLLLLFTHAALISGQTISTGCTNLTCRKILCLHGGGGTAKEFKDSIQHITARGGTMGYEFVFLTGPYTRRALWIRDPPGGKDSPTVDPNWDGQSIEAIDAVVAAEGPFYGILGYSQGTAMMIAYLAHAPVDTFQVGLVFCAYVPTTHHGLVDRINDNAPYSLPMYIYMSSNDWIIDNCMTNEFASKFVSPTRSSSIECFGCMGGGHEPPKSGTSNFEQIWTFLSANHTDGSYSAPAPTSYEQQLSGCPSFIEVIMRMYFWIIFSVSLCLCCCCGGCIFSLHRKGCCCHCCYRGAAKIKPHDDEAVELTAVVHDDTPCDTAKYTHPAVADDWFRGHPAASDAEIADWFRRQPAGVTVDGVAADRFRGQPPATATDTEIADWFRHKSALPETRLPRAASDSEHTDTAVPRDDAERGEEQGPPLLGPIDIYNSKHVVDALPAKQSLEEERRDDLGQGGLLGQPSQTLKD